MCTLCYYITSCSPQSGAQNASPCNFTQFWRLWREACIGLLRAIVLEVVCLSVRCRSCYSSCQQNDSQNEVWRISKQRQRHALAVNQQKTDSTADEFFSKLLYATHKLLASCNMANEWRQTLQISPHTVMTKMFCIIGPVIIIFGQKSNGMIRELICIYSETLVTSVTVWP